MRCCFRPTLVGLFLGAIVSWQAAHGELLTLLEGNVESGVVAVDSSGKGNHMVYLGSAGHTEAGQAGGALNFNADTSWGTMNQTAVGNSTIAASPTSVGDAFAPINESQEFAIGFWLAGGDTNPRNTSTFWARGTTPNGGNRGIQTHITWGNGSMFLDQGGCCDGATQRLSGALEEQHIKASVGDEWSHFVFSSGIDPETEVYTRRIYVNGEIYGFGGDPNALAEAESDGPFFEGENGYLPVFDAFQWAADGTGGNQWEGRLDDVFVYSQAMTPDEVANLYANGARDHFGVTFVPEPVSAQFIVANNELDSYSMPSEVTNRVFSESPVPGPGLAHTWYDGNMRPGGTGAAGGPGGVDAFIEARVADDGSPGGTDDYPRIDPGHDGAFLHGPWRGGQTLNHQGAALPQYPDAVAGKITGGNAGNHDNYGVILQGEMHIPESGTYEIRDGVDDFFVLAVDVDQDGELTGLTDLFNEDLGTLGIDNNIDDVYVADDDWANANGSSNPESTHAQFTFDDVPEGGVWVKIEAWMSEAGGGDAGLWYMAKADDPDKWNSASEDALTQDQIDKFLVTNDQLRSEGIALLSADATAELGGFEYIMQVGADGTHDSLDIDDNGGLYNTFLDVTDGQVTVETEEGVAEGTEIQIFGADNIVGLESLTINADGWDTSRLDEGILVYGDIGCDPNTGGDLDGNGTVEFADFLVLSNNFGMTFDPPDHTKGDIDCDGEVAFADFLVLSNNFGTSPNGAESVPEPTSALLISLAALAGLGCRRRR